MASGDTGYLLAQVSSPKDFAVPLARDASVRRRRQRHQRGAAGPGLVCTGTRTGDDASGRPSDTTPTAERPVSKWPRKVIRTQ